MRSYYKSAHAKRDWRSDGLPVFFIVVFVFVMCLFGKANAQRGNQSDWNVPPPLAPSTITKGDVDGRAGSPGAAVLAFTDVPAGIQPLAPVGVPDLPALTATPPEASQPQQPESGEVLAALQDVPVPEIPEMPAMPERSMQDVPEPPMTDTPMPTAPDMPPIPAEPAGNAAPTTGNTGLLPLMPEVSAPATFTGPAVGTTLWNTPGVPPAINFKLITN
jgi:hypothetical protein